MRDKSHPVNKYGNSADTCSILMNSISDKPFELSECAPRTNDGHTARSTEKIEQFPRRAIWSPVAPVLWVIICANAKAAALFGSGDLDFPIFN